MMTPDELERLPAPEICHSCGHWVQFRTKEGERQLRGKLKPQHPKFPWAIPRTAPSGGKQ